MATTTRGELSPLWLNLSRGIWLIVTAASLVLFYQAFTSGIANLGVVTPVEQTRDAGDSGVNSPILEGARPPNAQPLPPEGQPLPAEGQPLPPPSGDATGVASPYEYTTDLGDLISMTVTFAAALVAGILMLTQRKTEGVAVLAAVLLMTYGDIPTLETWVEGGRPEYLPFTGYLLWLVRTPGLTIMALLFPDGRFYPRWTRWVAVSLVFVTLVFTFVPGLRFWWPSDHNAFTNALSNGINIAYLLVVIGAQVYRYRTDATPVHRQQVKWLVLGLSMVVVLAALWVLPVDRIFPPPDTQTGDFLLRAGPRILRQISLPVLPIFMAMSILEVQLWEVDRVVNRVLVYGVLSVLVGGGFIVTILVLQQLIERITGVEQSSLVLVVTTLIFAGLLTPLRNRAQAFIDRAFYREKVNLTQAFADFSRELDELVEMNDVLRVLVERVSELLKLRHSAVYLRNADGTLRPVRTLNLEAEPASLSIEAAPDRQEPVSVPDDPTFPLRVPLVAPRGETLDAVGLLALGPRLSGVGYSRDDRSMLQGMAREAGRSIGHAQLLRERREFDALLAAVVDIGIALSSEQNFGRLLERILEESIGLCNADGGTLYLRTGQDQLEYVIVRNHKLGIALGGTQPGEITFKPLALFDESGAERHSEMAAHTVHTGQTVNIADAYASDAYDFSGPKRFDAENNYHSQSFLCVPLKGEGGEVIGVLQLINARSPLTGEIVPFEPNLQNVIQSLSALASTALTSYVNSQRVRRVKLEVNIDYAKREEEVSAIVEQDFFQALKQNVSALRKEFRKD